MKKTRGFVTEDGRVMHKCGMLRKLISVVFVKGKGGGRRVRIRGVDWLGSVQLCVRRDDWVVRLGYVKGKVESVRFFALR